MIRGWLRSWRARLLRPLAHQADLDNLYVQLSAFIEIKALLGPNVMLTPLRGFAMSPDALLAILQDVTSRKNARVVEFGSGQSTVAIAAAVRLTGAGHFTSVEHDPAFAAALARKLERLGLSENVDLRVVAIKPSPGLFGMPACQSYDLAGLESGFDVAVVDGPPTGRFGAATRAVPLQWCLDRLRGDAAIYLDDAAREHETKLIAEAVMDRTDLLVERLPAEKGLARLMMLTPAAG